MPVIVGRWATGTVCVDGNPVRAPLTITLRDTMVTLSGRCSGHTKPLELVPLRLRHTAPPDTHLAPGPPHDSYRAMAQAGRVAQRRIDRGESRAAATDSAAAFLRSIDFVRDVNASPGAMLVTFADGQRLILDGIGDERLPPIPPERLARGWATNRAREFDSGGLLFLGKNYEVHVPPGNPAYDDPQKIASLRMKADLAKPVSLEERMLRPDR